MILGPDGKPAQAAPEEEAFFGIEREMANCQARLSGAMFALHPTILDERGDVLWSEPRPLLAGLAAWLP